MHSKIRSSQWKVDVNALEDTPHQPGHSLAGIKLPFDAEGNRVN